MILKGFDIELHKDTGTGNWALVQYSKGHVRLEVYFDFVSGVNISKEVDSDSTTKSVMKEFPWLEKP
ncbi:MAG: hypothetical protein GY820_39125 [Gammaproteobacteria bacterium]|nr:hypothetical protein [Gammaproteobacteria bacterium]